MKKEYKTRVVLLDSHAIIHRAYHALPGDFQTRAGRPTGGLYGVCAILIKAIQELEPDYIMACYDLPGGTFRHAAYDDYKGGRAEIDEALIEQIEGSREIFETFGIPIYEMAGFEADDLLGTLAEELKKDKDTQIIIASGDMDTLQLVSDTQVQIYTPKKGFTEIFLYDEEAVVERYGFGSDLIPDYKGLSGDPSDNIIGIKGIGAKTATNLIVNFGTVEDIYIALKKNTQATQEKFKELKITPRIQGLLTEGHADALFSKELATIMRDVKVKVTLPKKPFKEGIDFAKTGKLFRELEFRVMQERLQKALGLTSSESEIELAKEEAGEKPKGKLTEEELTKYKLAIHLLNPTISNPTFDDIANYNAERDVKKAVKEIEKDMKEKDMTFVWQEMELPLVPMVEQMNKAGFTIDRKTLEKTTKKLKKKVDEFESKIHSLAGEDFNVRSTQQLSVVLFEKMGLIPKGMKKTPKGVISTKESELEKILDQHEIVPLILQFREVAKLVSTYTDTLLELINKDTGRIHSTFNPTGTVTGRMSSHDPNLQNIPVTGEYGPEIREAFVPKEGSVLVGCDYSQVELRVAALLSGDEKLLAAFKNGEDIHSAVARDMFGEETPETRRRAKVINFGILYGMGANALRKNLGGETTLPEAREYLQKYFETFSGLSSYLEASKAFVSENGYSVTMFGRRRYFPDINSKVPFIRAMSERMALNAPIQGTATADIIKLAMVNLLPLLTKHKKDVTMVAQVHDELIFEITKGKEKELSKEIVAVMENVLESSHVEAKYKQIPLKVDTHTGSNWRELK